MRIRSGRERDWGVVARGIAQTAWLTFAPRYAPPVRAASFQARARRVEPPWRSDHSSRQALFIAEDAHGYAGHVLLEERGDPWALQRYTAVLTIYVARRARRRGIGRRLLRRAYRWASARGHARIELSVAPHNQAALALYRSEGFETFLVTQVRPLKGRPSGLRKPPPAR